MNWTYVLILDLVIITVFNRVLLRRERQLSDERAQIIANLTRAIRELEDSPNGSDWVEFDNITDLLAWLDQPEEGTDA